MLFLFTIIQAEENFSVIFQWKVIDVIWPSQSARNQALACGEYIPKNNAITGIKIWKDQLYLTIPRWKTGVPVTLTVTPLSPQEKNPKLKPFPNWEMQKIGNCKAFQFVQSMEIDPKGRMWVLDSGRTATMTSDAKARCPPRLVILDLQKNGTVLRSYIFPSEVTPHDSVVLNDIVLDHEDGGFAYITDASLVDPGIIVYSLKNNTSWKIRHRYMWAESEEAMNIIVNNTHVKRPTNVDGIALSSASSKNRMVYYTPLAAFCLYSIPTSVLKNGKGNNVDKFVKNLGRRTSQTDGMMMSSNGVLYFGLFGEDAVAFWNTTQETEENSQRLSYTENQKLLVRDHKVIQWPDAFAIDKEGYLWCVPNSLQNFLTNNVDLDIFNYRIIRVNIKSKSYQFFRDDSVPSWAEIKS